MYINTGCQICYKPRSKAVYFFMGGSPGSMWLLCEGCTKQGSKFCLDYKGNSDYTDRYDLTETYLRDVLNGKDKGYYDKAFVFKCLANNKLLLSVPGLWSGYERKAVLDLESRKTVQVSYDIAIQVVEKEFEKLFALKY